jgi:Ca2+-binding EF-hand superfamily protein
LTRSSTGLEIPSTDHGKTLGELKIASDEKLVANRQKMDNIPKKPLLKSDKTLTIEAENAFGELFDEFSTDGLMATEDCVKFIQKYMDEKCKQSDKRVQNLFKNHDADNDGKVNKAEF